MHKQYVVAVLLAAAACSAQEAARPPRSARCKNPDCTEAISLVRAMSPYNGPDGEPYFEIGTTFSVHSKDNQGMWEGKFPNGKVGLFPRGLVTELNIFDKNPRFLVARDVTEPTAKVEPVAVEEPTTIEPDGGIDDAAQLDDANADPNVGSAEPTEEALPTFDKAKPDNGDTYPRDCPKWVARGGCHRNAQWMIKNCAESCWNQELKEFNDKLEETKRERGLQDTEAVILEQAATGAQPPQVDDASVVPHQVDPGKDAEAKERERKLQELQKEREAELEKENMARNLQTQKVVEAKERERKLQELQKEREAELEKEDMARILKAAEAAGQQAALEKESAAQQNELARNELAERAVAEKAAEEEAANLLAVQAAAEAKERTAKLAADEQEMMDKAEAERAAKEQAMMDQAEAQRAANEQVMADNADAQRATNEQAMMHQADANAEAQRAANEEAMADMAEAQRVANEEAQRVANEEAQRVANEEAQRVANAEAQRATNEQAMADMAEAQKAAEAQAIVDKDTADKAAKEAAINVDNAANGGAHGGDQLTTPDAVLVDETAPHLAEDPKAVLMAEVRKQQELKQQQVKLDMGAMMQQGVPGGYDPNPISGNVNDPPTPNQSQQGVSQNALETDRQHKRKAVQALDERIKAMEEESVHHQHDAAWQDKLSELKRGRKQLFLLFLESMDVTEADGGAAGHQEMASMDKVRLLQDSMAAMADKAANAANAAAAAGDIRIRARNIVSDASTHPIDPAKLLDPNNIVATPQGGAAPEELHQATMDDSQQQDPAVDPQSGQPTDSSNHPDDDDDDDVRVPPSAKEHDKDERPREAVKHEGSGMGGSEEPVVEVEEFPPPVKLSKDEETTYAARWPMGHTPWGNPELSGDERLHRWSQEQEWRLEGFSNEERFAMWAELEDTEDENEALERRVPSDSPQDAGSEPEIWGEPDSATERKTELSEPNEETELQQRNEEQQQLGEEDEERRVEENTPKPHGVYADPHADPHADPPTDNGSNNGAADDGNEDSAPKDEFWDKRKQRAEQRQKHMLEKQQKLAEQRDRLAVEAQAATLADGVEQAPEADAQREQQREQEGMDTGDVAGAACDGMSNLDTDTNCELMYINNPMMCESIMDKSADQSEQGVLCERFCCLSLKMVDGSGQRLGVKEDISDSDGRFIDLSSIEEALGVDAQTILLTTTLALFILLLSSCCGGGGGGGKSEKMYQEQLNKSTDLELKLGDLEAQVKKTTEQLQHESQAKQKVVRDSQAAFQKADELTQANIKLEQNVAEFRNQVQQSGFHSRSQAQAVTDLKSKIAALQEENMQLDTKLSQSAAARQAAVEAAEMQFGAVQKELKTALKENEGLATKMETLRKLNDEAGASANAVVEAKYKEASFSAAASEARALAAEAQVKKLESSKKGEDISKQAKAQAKLLQLDLDDAKEELARTAAELEELKAAMESPSAATSPDGESNTATTGGDDMGKIQALLAAERKAKKNLDSKLASVKDALKAQIAAAEAAASDSVAEVTQLTKLASELEMKVSLLKENFDDERRRNDSRVTKLDVELSRAKESENDAITARARIQERLDELEDMMKGDDSQLLAESRASNQQLEHKWLTAESNLQERQTQLKKAYHQIDELRSALERSRGGGGGPTHAIPALPSASAGSESGFSVGSTGARSNSKSHYGQSPAGPHGRRRPAPPPGPPSSARRSGKPPPPQFHQISSQGTPLKRPPMGQYGTPRGAHTQASPMARNLTQMQAQNIARISPAQQAARANANANAAASPLRPDGPPPHPGATNSHNFL